MATKVTRTPFDDRGSLMHYPLDRHDYTDAVRSDVGSGWKVPPKVIGPDWRPNVSFAAVLRLTGTCRGRSAAYFLWADDQGREFPMFLADMADLVRSGTAIAGGVAAAEWMVAKRGANYGIRLATDEETTGRLDPVP